MEKPQTGNPNVIMPEDVALMSKAFDGAWKALRSYYNNETCEAALRARIRLANSILKAHRAGERGLSRLIDEGLCTVEPAAAD
jgi:hypothetical protein